MNVGVETTDEAYDVGEVAGDGLAEGLADGPHASTSAIENAAAVQGLARIGIENRVRVAPEPVARRVDRSVDTTRAAPTIPA
jgi:hypothetical protein